MSLRFVYGATTAVVFACGVLAVQPTHAQSRDGGLLPAEESALITVVGCLVRGDDANEFILADPRKGPVNSVPEETCSAQARDNALELEDTRDVGLNDSMLGRWIEISGDLERETSNNPDNLRELEVKSFRVIPVVVPRTAVASVPTFSDPQPPAIDPAPIAQAYPDDTSTVGTSGQLPQTASYLPMSALAGLLSLGGVLALRAFRSRKQR